MNIFLAETICQKITIYFISFTNSGICPTRTRRDYNSDRNKVLIRRDTILGSKKDIKAIIFDLDGTLLNTIDDIADSMNTVLNSLGYPLHRSNVYLNYIGAGLDSFVRCALPESYRDDASVYNALNAMKQHYASGYANKTKPFEGILDLLEELLKRDIRLAVLSNKRDEFTKIMVSTYFPPIHFERVLGDRQNIALKPDPTAVMEILKALHVAPEEAFFVGDSKFDMQTAVNARCVAVGVSWGYGTRSELEMNGSQFILEKPADLLSLLN